MKTKLIIVIVICTLLITSCPTTYAAPPTLIASIPTFDVTLNGIQMNPSQSEYPLLVYKDITYIPMTYNLAHGLGLDVTFTLQEGLIINTGLSDVTLKDYIKSSKNPQSVNISLPTFPINVNSTLVDNASEDYPIITYNNITYFPLTWQWVNDTFGWSMTFDHENGLVISSLADSKTSERDLKSEHEDKNIYTQAYLQKLVDSTEPDEKIVTFRNTNNSRRNGQNKIVGKFFDLYYPEGQAFDQTARLLEPHMDKIYMMLTDLYGYQARVEVHLIDPTSVSMHQEGDIRDKEHITFIWVESDNDGPNGINNIAELVHEINHNFFEEGSKNHVGSRNMWIDEAHAKLIGSLYTHDLDPSIDSQIQQYSFYKPLTHLNLNIIDAEKNFLISANGDAWGWFPHDSLAHQAQVAGLHFWWNVYNQNDLGTFKSILRQLSVNRPSLEVMSEITGLSKEDLNAKYMVVPD